MIPLVLFAFVAGEPVVSKVGSGELDWTRGVLRAEVSVTANTEAWEDTRATEMEARHQLEAKFHAIAGGVPISAKLSASKVMSRFPEVGRQMKAGLKDGVGDWHVAETHYHRSGRVVLVGELDLLAWLKPYALEVAAKKGSAALEMGAFSGVLVDARNVAVDPSYAPRFLGPASVVVYDLSHFSQRTVISTTPVLWVSDAADPEVVERVGENPLMLVAESVSGRRDLRFRAADAMSLRELAATNAPHQRIPIVIVVSDGK